MASHSHEAGFFAGERLKERAQRDPQKTALVARQGRLTFILARGIGEAFVTREADMEVVTAVLEEGLRGR